MKSLTNSEFDFPIITDIPGNNNNENEEKTSKKDLIVFTKEETENNILAKLAQV